MYTPRELDLLADLLSVSARGRESVDTAERLLKQFGSFGSVFAADRRALEQCGLTEPQAALILALPGIARRGALSRLSRDPDLGDRARLEELVRALYMGVRNERFILLCLDGRGRLIEARTLAEGTLRGLRVQPRILIESAIASGAAGVIFCHNHPGGQAAFSRVDIQSTRVFWAQLNTVGVALIDHMLCAGDEVLSMRESCGLDETFCFPPGVRAGKEKNSPPRSAE